MISNITEHHPKRGFFKGTWDPQNLRWNQINRWWFPYSLSVIHNMNIAVFMRAPWGTPCRYQVLTLQTARYAPFFTLEPQSIGTMHLRGEQRYMPSGDEDQQGIQESTPPGSYRICLSWYNKSWSKKCTMQKNTKSSSPSPELREIINQSFKSLRTFFNTVPIFDGSRSTAAQEFPKLIWTKHHASFTWKKMRW